MQKSTVHRGKESILFPEERGIIRMHGEQSPMQAYGGERRAGERFPIRMNLRYRLSRNAQGTASEASGCVVDISSTGILFGPRLSQPPDAVMELSIDWPVRRDKAPPIRLSVLAMVVRSDDRGTAIRILHHEFEPWRDEPMSEEEPEVTAVAGEEAQYPREQ